MGKGTLPIRATQHHAELARLAGITDRTLRDVERDRMRPRGDLLAKLLLHVDANELERGRAALLSIAPAQEQA